jgi:recombination protein RecT
MIMSDLKNKLQTKAEETAMTRPQRTLQGLIKSMEGEIARALPAHIKPDRVSRIALTALRQNPDLEKCTPESFLAGLITSSQLGLEINTPLGQAYLIPYNNRRCIDGKWITVKEAQMQIGYKGIIDLAFRTGEYESIYAHEVDEADIFEFCYGLQKDLKHIPADKPTGKIKGYYAVYRLKNGGYDLCYMSMEAVKAHKDKFSKVSSEKGPWTTNFDEMAKKTVLKKVLKYAPMSVELSSKLAQDESIKEEIKPNMSESQNVLNYEVEYSVIDTETGEIIETKHSEELQKEQETEK